VKGFELRRREVTEAGVAPAGVAKGPRSIRRLPTPVRPGWTTGGGRGARVAGSTRTTPSSCCPRWRRPGPLTRAGRRSAAGGRRPRTCTAQYTSLHFTEHLALEGIAPSIGSVGDAYDNALMESIIGLHKTECIRRGPIPRRPPEDGLGRGIRHRHLGRMVEHPPPALHPRSRPTGRVRGSPLRCNHRTPTGAAARMRPAENP
jgi:transposase InsO family protein